MALLAVKPLGTGAPRAVEGHLAGTEVQGHLAGTKVQGHLAGTMG